MKRISCILGTLILCFCVAQELAAQELDDAQKAAAEVAKALSEAPEVEQKEEKPKYWTSSLKTNVNFGQTGLTNWAAGGDNTVSLAAFIDGNANYKKNDMFWNNRLQLDYGFLYASSKPIIQKSSDRIYLESKWGLKTPKMRQTAETQYIDVHDTALVTCRHKVHLRLHGKLVRHNHEIILLRILTALLQHPVTNIFTFSATASAGNNLQCHNPAPLLSYFLYFITFHVRLKGQT